MTMWMAWTLGVSMLIGIAAALAARVAAFVGAPRRFVWAFAIFISAIGPLLLPARGLALPWQSLVRSSAASERSPTQLAALPMLASAATLTREAYDWSTIAHRLDPWIVAAWALWSATLLVVLARALADVRHRSTSWTTVESEVGRVFIAMEDGPAVVGWLHPRIVIPTWALVADASTRGLILCHELEHRRAGDTRLLLFADLFRRAFPWNGALWWMANQLRLAVEVDCDARVVRSTGTAHSYGVMLLDVSNRVGRALPLAASTLAVRSDLERRLAELGAPRRPIAISIPYAVLAMVVLTTAAWTPRPGFPVRARSAVAADSDLTRVGYLHRKQTAAGIFLDSSDINHSARVFSEVFRNIRGLKISPTGDARTNVITSVSGGCAQVFVDGAPWQPSAAGDIDDFVNPVQMLAVEVYQPPNAPQQFAQAADERCASLVVWTQTIRRRRR
ncbi:MAG TPA: M56 family metallopeptidase [Gemmatimonadaceae bacterium]|jgi:beta-lactamase regulating signal transducer with metallopeptidase domain